MTRELLQHRELIVGGPLDRAIFHLGMPAALAALLQAGFLVVDTFWLGKVGAVAIAAVSTGGFVMWLAQTLAEGTATGSGAVLANAVGSAQPAAVQRAAAAGFAIAVGGSLLVSAAGLVVLAPVFAFMETAPAVTAAGKAYLLVILLAMPAYFLFAWIAAAFRALGDATTPLKLLGIAAAVNIVLDPLLIFGIGPFPTLGVTGAALATASSWAIACAFGWRLLRRAGVRPEAGSLFRPQGVAWRSLQVGLPLAAEGALFSVIYIALTRIITGFGTPAVAALGVGHKLEVLNYFVCAGMGAAATTLVGQSLGAGEPERAARAGWRTLFLTLVPVGVVTVALVTLPRLAVAAFIDDPAVLLDAVPYLLLVGISQPFMAFEVVLLGSFAGAQRTTPPAVLEISLTTARIPLAAGLVAAGFGIEGVWIAIALTTVLKGSVLAALFARWQHRFVRPGRVIAA